MALERQNEGLYIRNGNRGNRYFEELKEKWRDNGMCVIVLQCKNSLELFGIAEYLKQWQIPHHLYIDEGITEVSMGTPTALATGVLTEDQFWIFETMKLFGKAKEGKNDKNKKE
jgi:peptidyl-tRNA hydrolase